MELYRTWTGQSSRSQRSGQSKQIQQTSTRGSARDPLSGHLNHLNASQEAALDKFKSALHQQGLWMPGTSASRSSHDDATLLCVSSSLQSAILTLFRRYLRGRMFNVNCAIGQFSVEEE